MRRHRQIAIRRLTAVLALQIDSSRRVLARRDPVADNATANGRCLHRRNRNCAGEVEPSFGMRML